MPLRPSDDEFLALLRPEQGKLLRIARAITGQEHDAGDMVQEAILAAYRRFPDFRGRPDGFAPWLRRILINRSISLLRARQRWLPQESPADGAPDPDPGPEQRLSGALLWDEVQALEAHHRQVLTLRFLVDMPVEEVALLLRVPVGTVKSRVHRALQALRKRLDATEKKAVN